MYSVSIAYQVNGKIYKEIFQVDLLNQALSEARLKINTQIPKAKIVAIIILREDA